MIDEFKTISDTIGEGYYTEKRSKFLAFAHHVTTVDEVKEIVAGYRKKYYDARHCCYAYMLGPERTEFRANDDGEPSSSAGKPILGQLRSMGLQNTLVAVVRYFGGTLLGVPGLINAYKTAAYEALQLATIVEKTVTEMIEIQVGYEKMGDVMKFAKDSGFEYDSPIMENDFRLRIHIPAGQIEEMRNKFVEESWLVLE